MPRCSDKTVGGWVDKLIGVHSISVARWVWMAPLPNSIQTYCKQSNSIELRFPIESIDDNRMPIVRLFFDCFQQSKAIEILLFFQFDWIRLTSIVYDCIRLASIEYNRSSIGNRTNRIRTFYFISIAIRLHSAIEIQSFDWCSIEFDWFGNRKIRLLTSGSIYIPPVF